MFMSKIAFSVLWTLIIVVVFAVINGLGYVKYFLPPGFREATYWTYLPLMVSTSFAAVIGGCVGYRVSPTGKLPVKISLALCYAAMVAVLVFNLSMLIIVNVRGE
jgi:LytS/YehU family sensor histidine kinase